MQENKLKRYRPYRPLSLPDRTWPDNSIDVAPTFCSVDLRDGNQALPIPMNIEEKLELFETLVGVGFKEIEIGFPASSDIEYRFLRKLIEENRIPADVTVQVLTQAREELIKRTMESLKGCGRAIVHLYNSTSTLQRRVVFGMDKDEIQDIAVRGARLIKELVAQDPTSKYILEYSPESFTGTETDYAARVCDAVMEVWEPTTENKIILNLPATVEMTTPNLYADQIEYFIRCLKEPAKAVISLHTHNDRGCGVAATELGLMAGATRLEGTLFGNGERTGNVDVITVALNMYTQGVNPGLDFHDLPRLQEIYERVTRMRVHQRHPYSGELVYTAFSGSHQDAIHKGMAALNKARLSEKEAEKEAEKTGEMTETGVWQVPYLPIDPADVGRSYEAVIRINSQSGKGGVAYIMERNFGYALPKPMHPQLGKLIQNRAEVKGNELSPGEIMAVFREQYLENNTPFAFEGFKNISTETSGQMEGILQLNVQGKSAEYRGRGNGPLDVSKQALLLADAGDFKLIEYREHSLGAGSDARAAAYVCIETEVGKTWGAGEDSNITHASIRALVCALNRAGLKFPDEEEARRATEATARLAGQTP